MEMDWLEPCGLSSESFSQSNRLPGLPGEDEFGMSGGHEDLVP